MLTGTRVFRSNRLWLHALTMGVLLSCEGAVAPEVPPNVSVTLPQAQIEVNDTIDVVAAVTNSSGNPLTDLVVTWSSSNQAVASISSSGKVVGLSAGTATLSASAKGSSATATLTVIPPHVSEVLVTPPSAALRISQSVQPAVVLRDKRGLSLSGRPITWSSNNSAVASVDAQGKVDAVGAGIATVTATSEGRSASLSLAVTPVPVTSVVLSAPTVSLLISQTAALAATPRDSAGGSLSGRAVVWTSSSPTIASVSPTGVVTGIAPGTATVTATVEGVVSTATVQVAPVPVRSVVVSPASASRIVTLTAQFTAVANDSAGGALAGRTITWSTSNAAIATVTQTGLVTAVAPGSATITATSEGRSTSATVTVLPVPVATVAVTPATSSLFVGEAVNLSATIRDSLGRTLDARSITWSSSAPAIATVSSTGAVAIVGPGTATVTATSEGKSGSATISGRMRVSSLLMSPAATTLLVGQTQTITATPRDSTGAALTGRGIAWSTSNAVVGPISATGVFTAVTPGTTTLTASSEGVSSSAAITVIPVPVASVAITPATRSLYVTQTQQLTSSTLDSIGGTLTGRTTTWSSSAPAVATVSATGLVTAVAPGTATITGTSEGKSSTSVITVSLVPIVSVTLTAPRTGVRIGEDMLLTATPRDSINGALTGRVVTWSSSNTAVVGIDSSGFATAIAAGTSTITATSEGKSATILITVTPVPVSSVQVSPTSPTILAGATIAISATPLDSAGGPLIDRPVTWASNNPSVATVSATGVVTAVAPGIASISGTSEGKVSAASVGVVSALHPNELPGMVLDSERGFDGLTHPLWGDGFPSSNLSIVSDPSAPKSPTSVGRVRYSATFTGGYEPINAYRTLVPAAETLYVSFWVKFSGNWVGHPSGVNKIFHIFIGGLNRVYLSAQGTGTTGNLQPQVRLQQVNYGGGFVNLTPNLAPTTTLVRDQWHRWDVLLIANTGGNLDGRAEWWIDNVKVGQHSGISYVNETQGHNWVSVNLAPTWGGTGSTPGVEQYIFIDNVYISVR
jgi:trimeric autotransporter adhesin